VAKKPRSSSKNRKNKKGNAMSSPVNFGPSTNKESGVAQDQPKVAPLSFDRENTGRRVQRDYSYLKGDVRNIISLAILILSGLLITAACFSWL